MKSATTRRVKRAPTLLIAVAALAIAGSTATISRTTFVLRVASASMEPTLHCSAAPGCRHMSSDHVVVSTLPYQFSSPQRGDIVAIVLRPRHDRSCAGTTIVKRIVGLPGETIAQTNGVVHVNGHPLFEPYLAPKQPVGPDFQARPVPTNSYFVLGDNRPLSCDSREIGPVGRQEISGKAIIVF
jgi:signal peptidase I